MPVADRLAQIALFRQIARRRLVSAGSETVRNASHQAHEQAKHLHKPFVLFLSEKLLLWKNLGHIARTGGSVETLHMKLVRLFQAAWPCSQRHLLIQRR